MTLKQYLEKHEISYGKFGRMMGVKTTTVSRWANGERNPDFQAIRKIAELTDDSVRADDWVYGESNAA